MGRALPLWVAGALAGASAEAKQPIYLREGERMNIEVAVPSPRWYALTPVAADYANPLPCPSKGECAVEIKYTWVELPALAGQSIIEVSSVPELRSPGTHRIRPSAEPLGLATMYDIADTFELVIRRDDTYAGYASELIGVPFVLNPTLRPDGAHQTDARVGADCVALVIYGQRRMGHMVPYVAPSALDRYTDPVQGPIQAGDVLHFGFQTAILVEDRGVIGALDDPDRVLQTWHGLAEILVFGALPYKDAPVTALRWKTPL